MRASPLACQRRPLGTTRRRAKQAARSKPVSRHDQGGRGAPKARSPESSPFRSRPVGGAARATASLSHPCEGEGRSPRRHPTLKCKRRPAGLTEAAEPGGPRAPPGSRAGARCEERHGVRVLRGEPCHRLRGRGVGPSHRLACTPSSRSTVRRSCRARPRSRRDCGPRRGAPARHAAATAARRAPRGRYRERVHEAEANQRRRARPGDRADSARRRRPQRRAPRRTAVRTRR